MSLYNRPSVKRSSTLFETAGKNLKSDAGAALPIDAVIKSQACRRPRG